MSGMDQLINLVEEDKKRTEEVLSQTLEKEENVLFAYLHGSFAEGRPFRDIDIAVFVKESKIPKEKSLDFEMSISLRLEKIIKMPVDVKVINYAPLGFQYHSTGGILLVCRDDDLRVDFLTKMRSLYFDFKPSSERFLKEMLHAE
jgi:predicted nucleotidyltransferase